MDHPCALASARCENHAQALVCGRKKLPPAPATIRDVARAADLSVASVSRALNGHANVHPDTRARVERVARALAYTPNAAARSLSTARSHAIGVVLPDLHGEFFSELVRGIDRVAQERRYMLLLSNMHADSMLAGQALAAMRGRVDGLIVMAPQLGALDLARVLPAGIPALLLNSPDEQGYQALRIDNRAGVFAMVRHLVERGRRRIVHLAGMEGNRDGEERRQAFTDAMAELAPGAWFDVREGDFTEATGAAIVAALLADGIAFDAIFAANDMMALGAMQALRDAGIDVPGAVAVAGFDDVPLARYLDLTTMRVDMVGLGERAVHRLVDRIEEIEADVATTELVPTLVERGTTRSHDGA